jgi:hypothetical protein
MNIDTQYPCTSQPTRHLPFLLPVPGYQVSEYQAPWHAWYAHMHTATLTIAANDHADLPRDPSRVVSPHSNFHGCACTLIIQHKRTVMEFLPAGSLFDQVGMHQHSTLCLFWHGFEPLDLQIFLIHRYPFLCTLSECLRY